MCGNSKKSEAEGAGGARLPVLAPLIGVLAAFLAALALDRSAAVYFQESGKAMMLKGTWVAWVLKFPGDWVAAALTLGAAWVLGKSDKRGFVLACVSLAIPLSNGLLKWGVGRHRPYRFLGESIDQAIAWNCIPFRGGIMGLFKATNLSFASGHACMAFTLATVLAVLFPRWRVLFFIAAFLTACERVAENAHWTSDAVAGAAMGYFGVWAASRIKFFRNLHADDCRLSSPAE